MGLRLRYGLVLVGALELSGVANAQELQGPFLTIEGQAGLFFGHMTESGNYTPGDPADPWAVGGAPLRSVAGIRAEAGWDFGAFLDGSVRLGVVVSGNSGSSSLSRNVTGIVAGQPSLDGEPPQWEISIPSSGAPNQVDFSAQMAFWEVMPEVEYTLPETEHGKISLGLQPFYGEFSETSSSAYTFQSFEEEKISSIENSLSGRVLGALVTVRNDVQVSDSLRLFFGGGIGGYSAQSSATIEGVQNGVVIDRQATVQGVRGQLAVGTNYRVSPQLSVGTVARLDM